MKQHAAEPPLPDRECWVCRLYRGLRTVLVEDTDGNGNRVEVCATCRPELEKMQRELEQLRAKLTPRRVGRLCRKCKKQPAVFRKHFCEGCAAPAVKPSKRCACGAAIHPRARECEDCKKRRWTEAHTHICHCGKSFLFTKKGWPPKKCRDCRFPPVAAPAPHVGPRQTIRFNPGNKGLRGTGSTRDQVLLLNAQHPEWHAREIAARVGKTRARVGQILVAEGIHLKKGKKAA
jgi:hypothetical protein